MPQYHEDAKPKQLLLRSLLVLAIVALMGVLYLELAIASAGLSPNDSLSITWTRRDMRLLSSALETYRLDYGRFPFGSEGLEVLTTPVSFLTSLPIDSHSRDGAGFRYLSNGVDYVLIGRGPDREFAGGLPTDVLSRPWEEALEILRRVTYDPTNGVPSPGDIWGSTLLEREVNQGRAWVFDKDGVPVPP